MVKILVVDDEAGIREMLHDALGLAGFEVHLCIDGFEALKFLRTQSVDLIIADINMPKVDGYELLERLRENGITTPALLLTARHERQDVAQGFRVGADDYVTKPFSLEELVFRVNAILRRTNPAAESAALSVGPITLDDESHEVLADGTAVDLSPTEYRLLKYLMEHAEKVVRKETLLDAIRTVRGIGFQITGKAN